MKGIHLFWLAFVFIVAACSKDNGNNPKDDDDDDDNGTKYTQVAGDWEWVGKYWLHVANDHGVVHQAWVVNGQLYCHWIEDIGAQFLGQLSHYNGTTWSHLNTDVNADGQTDFAVHNNKLYQTTADANGCFTVMFDGATATFIDTIPSPGNFYYYLGSSGSTMYRVVAPSYAPVDTLRLEQWDGNDFVPVERVGINAVASGITDIEVFDGPGEIYIKVKQPGQEGYNIYSYNGAGTFGTFASIAYGSYAPRVKMFVHGTDVYLLEGLSNTSDGAYRKLSKLEEGGTTTVAVDRLVGDTILFEAYPTPQGIVYTQGVSTNGGVTPLLTDIMLWNGTTTLRYNTKPDEASMNAALPTRLVGDGGLYNGGVYLFYNNALHVMGNAHAGVFSTTGQPALKVFLGRYNKD